MHKHSRPPDTIDALRELIPKFGLSDPIVKSPTGAFIDGELRAQVMDELSVPYDVQIMHTEDRIIGNAVCESLNRELIGRRGSTHAAQVEYLLGRYPTETIISAVGVTQTYYDRVLREMVPDGVEVAGATEEVRVQGEMPTPHECLSYIPECTPEQYEATRADIAANGQKKPILVDVSGKLIDGRARWRICTDLGITPVTQRFTGNPWERSIRENNRFPNEMERLFIAARIPPRMGGGVRLNDMRPPSSDFLCEAWDLSWGTLKPARVIVNLDNSGPVEQAIRDGVISPGTGKRIVKNTPATEWARTISKIRRADQAGTRRPELPQYPDEIRRHEVIDPLIPTNGNDRSRRRYLAAPQVTQANDNLVALGLVIDSGNGLDPRITPDQAAAFLRDLTGNRRSVNRLIALLKERKEATP